MLEKGSILFVFVCSRSKPVRFQTILSKSIAISIAEAVMIYLVEFGGVQAQGIVSGTIEAFTLKVNFFISLDPDLIILLMHWPYRIIAHPMHPLHWQRNSFFSMSKSPDYPPIDKLEEGNYRSWHIDIRSRLRIRELWKYTEKRPEGLDAMTEEQWKREPRRRQTPTISRSFKAMLLHGNDYDDAYIMMTKLAAYFRPTGDAEFMRLTKELYTIKYDQFKLYQWLPCSYKNPKRTNFRDKRQDDGRHGIPPNLLPQPPRKLPIPRQTMVHDPPNMTAEIALKTFSNEELQLKQVEEKTPQQASSAARKRTHSDTRATAESFYRTCNKPHSELSCWRLHPELMPE